MTHPSSDSRRELRSLLVRAAREILAEPETPFELRKVAERVGKSRTAPYVAFGKTEEGGGLSALRLAVAAEGLDELAQTMEDAAESSPDAESGLEALAAAYLAYAMDHPRVFRLVFGAEVARDLRRRFSSPDGGREQEAVARARARMERVILNVIEAQSPGYMRHSPSGDERVVSGAIWAMLHGVATLTLDEQWGLTRVTPSEDPHELAHWTLRFLTHASSRALRDVALALERAKEAKEAKEAKSGGLSASHDGRIFASAARPVVSAMAAYRLEESPSMRQVRAHHERLERTASPALHRLRAQWSLVEGARILWVDDHPESPRHEREMFEGLGAVVTMVRSTAEAAEVLDGARFDLIISDIRRGGDAKAGLRAIKPLRELGGGVPLVLYVGSTDPGRAVPAGAFGITSDPEELLHLVLDALGRGKR
jgi:CheY-like chemotaxis protein